MPEVQRKDTADRIAERLTEEGHSVASLHGDKMTRERDDILDGFRNGKTKVLITTNVIARGIDIQQVNMVVNYDVPDMGPEGDFRPDVETYIHRIGERSRYPVRYQLGKSVGRKAAPLTYGFPGRTGRFGRKGCSVIFVHDDRSKRDVEGIIYQLGKPMRRIDASRSTDLEQLEQVSPFITRPSVSLHRSKY